ncbi:MAG: LacI family DNA-binding transcriptional regulator [Bacteroidota bacterium]
MPRHTIKDVARDADVSVATVSAVVNGAAWVSAPTRSRVQDTIDRLGYRPNRVAQSLKTRESRAVGVIVSDLTNPFFTEAVRGLQHRLRDQGRSLLLADADQRTELGGHQLALLIDKQVDGLILMGDSVPEAALRALSQRRGRVPVVTVGRDYRLGGVSTILVESEEASYEATRHLIDRGYARVAHVTGPDTEEGGLTHGRTPRINGYTRALTDAGLPVRDEWVVAGDWRAGGGAAAMNRLLTLGERPDAVFFANDMMALGAMGVAREAGLAQPDALAVVGFDDVPAARLVAPALTTMRMPKADLGRAAGDLLDGLLAQPGQPDAVHRRFAAELVVRASSPPKQ